MRAPKDLLIQPQDLGIGKLFESIRDAVIVAEANTGQIVLWNSAATQIFGYSQSEALRKRWDVLVPERFKAQCRAGMARYRDTGHGPYIDSHTVVELPALHKSGEEINIEISLSPIESIHNLMGDSRRFVLAIVRDVTERKRTEDRLHYLAYHDLLTDLPNRQLFTERLQQALKRTRRRRGREVAVLFMDLDNFKFVNDSLSHEAGDRLLTAVAELLSGCLRPEDTVARLGGDEFAVLLEDLADEGEATRVAERITRKLRAPFVLNAQEVFITPSIGIAFSASDQDLPETLLRNADVAMYRAKEEGKAHHRVFDPSMEAQVVERLRLENDLRRALERDEIRVYYQPVVRLNTERIVGMEALVRWEHPVRGLVLPDEFVPLAEEIGLTIPIGRQLLREACQQAREWQERYTSDPPLIVSANLSTRQLQHPDLVGDVEEALRESGLDPKWLILEITESAVIRDEEYTIGALKRLGELGVRVALDDFGMGYSSLSYLRRLPVDLVKIDKSFVGRIGKEGEDEVLTSGVIGIAHGLGLYVCAEGVETPEQLAWLKSLGCNLAQGNYFSKPLPSEAAGELLATYDDYQC